MRKWTQCPAGGNEFVVLLNDLHADRETSTQQASQVAEKMRFALAQPYKLAVKQGSAAASVLEHHCIASIGVAMFMNHESSRESVLLQADSAMYRAKGQGRNRIEFHVSGLGSAANRDYLLIAVGAA